VKARVELNEVITRRLDRAHNDNTIPGLAAGRRGGDGEAARIWWAAETEKGKAAILTDDMQNPD
jgi:hypothetical protein